MPASWSRSTLVFLGFLALSVVFEYKVWQHPATRIAGLTTFTTGDNVSAMWLLAWTPHALAHHVNLLYARALAYPTGANLAWNPLSPLLGFIGWPALSLFGPVVDYNAVMALGAAATAWAGHVCVCHFVGRRWLGILGGGLLLISPYVDGQVLAHPSLAIFPAVPLSAIALDEAWGGRRRSTVVAGVALGACWLGVLLISTEMFASLALMTGMFAVCCALHARRTWRTWWRRSLETTVIAYAVVLPYLSYLLWAMFDLHGRVSVSKQTVSATGYSADLLSFVVPTHARLASVASLASGVVNDSLGTRGVIGVVEEGMYVGIPFLLVLAWGIWRARKTVAVYWLIVGGIAALLSLGPRLHAAGLHPAVPLPEAVFTKLPLLRELVPLRFGLFVSLAVAMSVPLILEATLRPLASEAKRAPSRARVAGAVCAGCVLLGIASWVPRFPPISNAVAPIPPAIRADLIPAGAVVMFAPQVSHISALPMLWQALDGFRFDMPQAYEVARDDAKLTGPAYEYLAGLPFERAMIGIQNDSQLPIVTPVLRVAILAEFRRDHVGLVVAGPMQHEGAAVHFIDRLLRFPGIPEGGLVVWKL